MRFKGKKRISVGIIGGAGYSGAELVKLLLFHPRVELSFVTSRRHAGKPVSSVNRFLAKVTDLCFIEPDIEALPADTDVIFLATPHGTSMNLMPEILKALPRVKIIDLSGDFRLRNPDLYRQYYNLEHSAADLLDRFAYGLSELNRDRIRDAQYVANPGCFATGIIFALMPLFSSKAVRREVSVIAVTGSSGSGDLPKEVTHHPVRSQNFKSYKILEHQHTPEIEQFFRARFINWDYEIGFVPQSGPFVRGIYTTAMVYNETLHADTLSRTLGELYGEERFIRIVEGSPEVNAVQCSNYVEVSCMVKRNFVITMCAIDNLVRGASGQAVQNMNIMFGFDEQEGIEFPGMRP
jgi:N-acetyl-gamma-glutamyl-phosphate/LysW-gamma-L-alpha-aminoadipyl-6-phosphate reductase